MRFRCWPGFLAVLAQSLAAQRPGPVVAVTGVTAFVAPHRAPIENAVIVMAEGRIVAIGKQGTVKVPAGAERISCPGCSAFSGFYNLHVHFSQPIWAGADTASAERLSSQFRSMLLRWGFVHVLDTGSFLGVTLPLKARVAGGDIDAPDIRTAGPPFTAVGGSPFYIPIKLPAIASAAVATDSVKVRLAAGADFVKIFSSAPVARGQEVTMPLEIVTAITAEAHRQHRLVAAHPTSNRGAAVAMEGGVDILLHTTPDGEEPWDSAFVKRLIAAKIAIAPTLKLWKWELERGKRSPALVERFIQLAEQQIGAFAKAGGDAVFGTDVGYMTDYDPKDEYVFLGQAGLGFDDVLAMLTTTPARRLGESDRRGTLRAGAEADLVLINGRPDRDLTAFTAVRSVWRRGRKVFDGGAR